MAHDDPGETPAGGAIGREVFSTDGLPAHLDNRARFRRWHEVFEALICCVDMDRHPDRPFAARFEFAEVDGVRISRFEGTMSRVARSASSIACGPDDDFCLMINRGPATMCARQIGREAVFEPGSGALISNDAVLELLAGAPSSWVAVAISRERLRSLVGGPDELRAQRIDRRAASMRHLGKCLEGIMDLGEIGNEPELERHIGATVADLLALVLGAHGEPAEMAAGRSLRAARLREVLAEIKAGFADPAFSPRRLALKVGLSPRYVQDLLHETGSSFTERVLELRLQRARAMLASRQYDRLKVSEIAYASGFSEVSYFNQTFRRRFGCSPTQCRGGAQSSSMPA